MSHSVFIWIPYLQWIQSGGGPIWLLLITITLFLNELSQPEIFMTFTSLHMQTTYNDQYYSRFI